MNNADLYKLFELGAPQYSAGIYTWTPAVSSTLAAVCRHLQASFDTLPLAQTVAIATEFPTYAGFMYGLPAPVESLPVSDFHKSLPADNQLLEASMEVPVVGRAVAGFETISPDALDLVHHPLRVTINAASLDTAQITPTRGGDDRAASEAEFLMRVLRELVDLSDPLFGAIVAEEPVPTPLDLAAGRLRSGDIYLSSRLLRADDELVPLLAEAYADGYTERWDTGSYFSNWAPMNPVGKTTRRPFTPGSTATAALGRALDSVRSD